MLKLFGYWRSTAAYRVRIALNIKQVPYENLSVHLVKDGGEQHKSEYRALNPQGLVPTLVDGELKLSQSMAILEYLEEKYPSPALLPANLQLRAEIRAFCQMIACDIHPLNNLRVLKYLAGPLSVADEQKNQWYAHWITEGFKAVESLASQYSDKGPFCFGRELSMADMCLIPQIYNAHRFNVPLDAFPRLVSINEHCLSLAAFRDALPESQPDAVS
ncbi:maleylacetoacetate isomerase [Pleionea sp. CnH1-48]|uniref:maleylacetoacetate isomerase n=1 Tax=Pleionea sp. CnH1-48 TaxID=2954494 RepID=UPI002096B59F|nr:maleylacetoacetate isomerase [Pleionea sp. CnH1-48]MCO7227217.1 maleylacetoacetate isomerase [Pleionea sp. CnH1-48]